MGKVTAPFIVNLRFAFFIAAIFSVFSPITIYPCLFFIFVVLQIALSKDFYLIDRSNWNFFLYIYTFMFFSLISYLINYDVSDGIQFVKMWINLNFMIAAIAYIKEKNKIINLDLIKYLLEIIIVLSFIQIVINVGIMDLWMLPIQGVENSMIAYSVTQPPVYFGIGEKNIWATKIVLVQIIYIAFHFIRFFKDNNLKYNILMAMMLFNVIYTFSRTAQIAFFISMIIIFYLFLKKNFKDSHYLKYVVMITFSVLVYGIGNVLYDKLLHLDLSSGDGMMARLELWEAFYENIKTTTYLYGNGILSAANIIPNNTQWNNNNFHNVFLNIFNDTGLLGTIAYLMILYVFFFQGKDLNIKIFKIGVLFMPLFIIMNSQYLGYDNDIVIYLILVQLILSKLREREYEE